MNEDTINNLECVSSFHILESVDSTNEYAKKILPAKKNGIQVVAAGKQSRGKGRNGRGFFSSVQGGLWVSLCVNVDDISNHFVVNRALSLAIYDAIFLVIEKEIRLAIKWPNDIYLNDKKVCGILLEASAKYPNRIIAGFGLNVNFPVSALPAEISVTATSLYEETGKYFNETELLKNIIVFFTDYLNKPSSSCGSLYQDRLFRKGSNIMINNEKGIFSGVSQNGELILETPKGNKYFNSGDIVFET